MLLQKLSDVSALVIQENNQNLLRRNFIKLLLISFVIILFISTAKLRKFDSSCQPIIVTSRHMSALSPSRGPPYSAYIIAHTEKRFNATFDNLTNALPGFFNIQRIQSMSYNDSRIAGAGDLRVASLLLTHINIWNEFGSKSDTDVGENDWVFVFEDDVGVIPISIMKRIYRPIYKSFARRYPNPVVSSMQLLV